MNSSSPPESQNLMAPAWPTWDGPSLPSPVVTKAQKFHCPVISLELFPEVSLPSFDHLSYLEILETRSLCGPVVGPALSPGLGIALLN